MPIGPGSRVGPYEITALIGEGGMGKVWRGHHTALKRDDALKVLPAFLERGASNEAATFSPDSRYVAYVSAETGQPEIYIRSSPGPGGQETVSVGGGREPVWTKSGELFYRSLTGERMMAVSVTTRPTLKVGRPVQLFEGPYFISPTGSLRPQYDVTSDGQRFLMLTAGSAADGSGDRPRMVVIQNWTEELKRVAATR